MHRSPLRGNPFFHELRSPDLNGCETYMLMCCGGDEIHSLSERIVIDEQGVRLDAVLKSL